VDRNVPVITVWASRGKVTRAEPVSALYEQGKIHHIGTFSQLEDQMRAFTIRRERLNGGGAQDAPNKRADGETGPWTGTSMAPVAPGEGPRKGGTGGPRLPPS